MDERPTSLARSLCSPVTQHVSYSAHHPLCAAPSNAGGPSGAAPSGSPGCRGTAPHYTHNPYTPHKPLLEIHSLPAYPADYMSEPRYGLPPLLLPPSPLPVAPPPDQCDLELAYLRGHVAGLDRRSEPLAPPPGGHAPSRCTRPQSLNPTWQQSEKTPRHPRQHHCAWWSPGTIAAPSPAEAPGRPPGARSPAPPSVN